MVRSGWSTRQSALCVPFRQWNGSSMLLNAPAQSQCRDLRTPHPLFSSLPAVGGHQPSQLARPDWYGCQPRMPAASSTIPRGAKHACDSRSTRSVPYGLTA